MDLRIVVRESKVYDIATTLFRWFEASRTGTLLSSPVVIRALLAGFVILSIGSVMLSNMNAAIKFLSFAFLFVLMAFLVWSSTEPLPEG